MEKVYSGKTNKTMGMKRGNIGQRSSKIIQENMGIYCYVTNVERFIVMCFAKAL